MYHAYDDYNEYSVRYVEEDGHILAEDFFLGKELELIVWNIDFDRVPGYEVSKIYYLNYQQPLKEQFVYYYAGSDNMLVIMKKKEIEDKIPPEIYAGDVYFPIEAANRGKLSYDYLLELFCAKDNVDGVLFPHKEGMKNGYYIEGYDKNLFLNASAGAVITLKVGAVDQAGNKSEKEVRCYLVDTGSRHMGDGRKKRVRFVNA